MRGYGFVASGKGDYPPDRRDQASKETALPNSRMRQSLLLHRDARGVDLPPRTGVSIELLVTDINQPPDPPLLSWAT